MDITKRLQVKYPVIILIEKAFTTSSTICREI